MSRNRSCHQTQGWFYFDMCNKYIGKPQKAYPANVYCRKVKMKMKIGEILYKRLNLTDSWAIIEKWNTSSSHYSNYTIVLLLEVPHEQTHINALPKWRNVGSALELERQIPIWNMHAQVEDELKGINYWFLPG